jgi:hypothetical protein
VWVHPRQLDTCLVGEASQPAGGAVPVHPGAARDGPGNATRPPDTTTVTIYGCTTSMQD